MAITTNKKEKEKKKAKAKQEKAQKMLDRKQNTKKGKSLEEMMAYVDENGNLSSTPPGAPGQKTLNTTTTKDSARKGTLTSFNDAKGYGFITDLMTKESIFVHASSFKQLIQKNDAVSFEIERNAKGASAVNVRKLM